jgi:hypothetical protein
MTFSLPVPTPAELSSALSPMPPPVRLRASSAGSSELVSGFIRHGVPPVRSTASCSLWPAFRGRNSSVLGVSACTVGARGLDAFLACQAAASSASALFAAARRARPPSCAAPCTALMSSFGTACRVLAAAAVAAAFCASRFALDFSALARTLAR